MSKNWFIIEDGQRRGPFSSAKLATLARSGKLHRDAIVQLEGKRPIKAGSVKGLFNESEDPLAATNERNPTANEDFNFDNAQSETQTKPRKPKRQDQAPTRRLGLPIIALVLIGGSVLVLGFVLAISVSGNLGRPSTTAAADEEFRVAASHKGQDALHSAQLLIRLRRDDHFSWEQLEDIDITHDKGVKAAFDRWKRDRIAAGDRYK